MLGRDTSKNLVAVELVLSLKGCQMVKPIRYIGENLVALELKHYTIIPKLVYLEHYRVSVFLCV